MAAVAITLLARADPILAIPILLWFVAYACMLRVFVPRMRERSRAMSEMRSTLTGRIVDSYTNIVTVKLFARARDEDAFVREAVDDHTAAFHRQLRMTTGWTLTLACINACMVVGTASLAILAVARGAGVDRDGGHGAAAGLADQRHGGLGRDEHHRDLRECRRGAGRDALDRGHARHAGPAGER